METLDLTTLYSSVDDFWKIFKAEWEKHLIDSVKSNRGKEPELSISEMMTILILFRASNYRTFKHFYFHVAEHYRSYFPKLISYSRFIHTMKGLFVPLFAFILQHKGAITEIAFIDSTSLRCLP
jgi:hypothetical protein